MAALVLLADVEVQVAMRLEANPDDGSYAAASATDQEKYHPTEITKAALFIDLEITQTIIDTVDHGDRSAYLQPSADLINGAEIDPHPGKIGTVEIKLADATYQPGILVKNSDRFRKYVLNPDGMYGTTTQMQGRYHISEEGRIYFIGSAARIQIAPDLDNTGVCQAPKKYTAAEVRGTIAFLRKANELPQSFFDSYAQDYHRDLVLIRAGAAALPPLEAYKKLGG